MAKNENRQCPGMQSTVRDDRSAIEADLCITNNDNDDDDDKK